MNTEIVFYSFTSKNSGTTAVGGNHRIVKHGYGVRKWDVIRDNPVKSDCTDSFYSWIEYCARSWHSTHYVAINKRTHRVQIIKISDVRNYAHGVEVYKKLMQT